MPRSATGTWTDRRRAGFTLVELLAVIAIMAALTGLVVISVGDGGRDREVHQHAQRLAALIELAREEVLLGAGEVGVAFTRHRYHFQRQQLVDDDTVEWRDIPDADTLRPRSLLDDDLELALRVAGRGAPLELDPEHPDPQVFIEGSGEITPFELFLIDSDDRERAVRLTGEMDGSLAIDRPGPRELP
ncbi:type II secretion system minor pseudopilin GspH [Halorhodospira halophila]|uniref:Type II secretion system protein H n=1 Tax=Halorhodospira halophila (strain DSM 244 / SL1) TaxID=349124 RepID=A1WZM4_HALHL|nr:type II secretion system minor pseudopilin GspH [Halorhodospira halophila]ABM63136.1 general secretion pathway protein H [Halorhodospira halophila SL1]MBK1729315.1 type II secretion system protein GspH [Halorhodospira halophila]